MILKYLDGHGPLPTRGGIIGSGPQKHDPPAGLVKRLDGFGVETYREKNARGDIIEVICFACDTVWLKSWVSMDLGDHQRVVPKLEGAYLLRHPVHKHLHCPCAASRYATRNQPSRQFAGYPEVVEALEYDLKLNATTSTEGELGKVLGSAGGGSLGG